MKLITTHLKEGEHSFSFASDRDGWMKDLKSHIESRGYTLPNALEVNFNLTKLEPDYFVRGEIRGRVQQVCARCAETFDLNVKNPFEVAFAHISSDKVRGAQMADESEEFDINFFEGNEIDLSPIVEEQFFLSLPYQAICRADCQGMCQKCGCNLNEKSCGCPKTDMSSPFSVLQNYEH